MQVRSRARFYQNSGGVVIQAPIYLGNDMVIGF